MSLKYIFNGSEKVEIVDIIGLVSFLGLLAIVCVLLLFDHANPSYNKAIINYFDGCDTVDIIDYQLLSDSHMQITLVDGTTMLISSVNCTLINE